MLGKIYGRVCVFPSHQWTKTNRLRNSFLLINVTPAFVQPERVQSDKSISTNWSTNRAEVVSPEINTRFLSSSLHRQSGYSCKDKTSSEGMAQALNVWHCAMATSLCHEMLQQPWLKLWKNGLLCLRPPVERPKEYCWILMQLQGCKEKLGVEVCNNGLDLLLDSKGSSSKSKMIWWGWDSDTAIVIDGEGGTADVVGGLYLNPSSVDFAIMQFLSTVLRSVQMTTFYSAYFITTQEKYERKTLWDENINTGKSFI